jgi:hypothetical protein
MGLVLGTWLFRKLGMTAVGVGDCGWGWGLVFFLNKHNPYIGIEGIIFLWASNGLPRASKGLAKGFQKGFQWGSKHFHGLPKDIKILCAPNVLPMGFHGLSRAPNVLLMGFHGLSRAFKGFQGFQGLPRASKGFQGLPMGFQWASKLGSPIGSGHF